MKSILTRFMVKQRKAVRPVADVELCPGCDEPTVIDHVVQGDAVPDPKSDDWWCRPCAAAAEMDARC